MATEHRARAANTNFAVRRIQHADQVVILNSKGQIEAKGPPETFYKTDEASKLLEICEDGTGKDSSADEKNGSFDSSVQANTLVTPVSIEDKHKDRRFGDSAMYAFYARGVGLVTLITFLFAMGGYAACGTFPSKFK